MWRCGAAAQAAFRHDYGSVTLGPPPYVSYACCLRGRCEPPRQPCILPLQSPLCGRYMNCLRWSLLTLLSGGTASGGLHIHTGGMHKGARSCAQGPCTSACVLRTAQDHLLRVLPRCFTEVMRRIANPLRAILPWAFKSGTRGMAAIMGMNLYGLVRRTAASAHMHACMPCASA